MPREYLPHDIERIASDFVRLRVHATLGVTLDVFLARYDALLPAALRVLRDWTHHPRVLPLTGRAICLN